MENQKAGVVAPFYVDEGFDVNYMKEITEAQRVAKGVVFEEDPLFRGDQTGPFYEGMLAGLNLVSGLFSGKTPFKVIQKILDDVRENAVHCLLTNGVEDTVKRRPYGDDTLLFVVDGKTSKEPGKEEVIDVKLRRMNAEEAARHGNQGDKVASLKRKLVAGAILSVFQGAMGKAMDAVPVPSGEESPQIVVEHLKAMTAAVTSALGTAERMLSEYEEKFEKVPGGQPTTQAPVSEDL